MIPKRVTLENFLSFGPKQELVFDDGEPLWVVGGPNGVGKSAVFDAITFCLFGAHRGGAKETDPLVRHGATGFSVGFEFEFQGADYRVVRNRTGKGPTQSVEQFRDGQWRRVPNINGVEDVKKWAERTLGLGFDAFQASVLLRQGHADKILTAGGRERLEILRKIIGAERYKALSDRVHAAAAKKDARLEELQKRRAAMPVVTEEQLAAATLAQQAAEDAKAEAEAARAAAGERVTQAKAWATHEAARRALARKIAEADARAADAERIQRDHARLEELARVLPTLEKLVPVRDGLPATEAAAATARERHAAAAAELADVLKTLEALRLAVATHREAAGEHARKAKELRGEIAARERFLAAAEEVAALDAEVRGFDPKLDDHARAAAAKYDDATAAERTARDEKTALDTRLAQAREDEARLADVKVGVECSRCGQVVSAEHAAKERAEVADKLRELTAAHGTVTARLKDAAAAVKATKKLQDELAVAVQKQNKSRERLADRRRDLEALGGTSDAATLRADLAKLTSAATEAERVAEEARAKHARHEAELKAATPRQALLNDRVQHAAATLQTAEKKLATDAATRDALTGALPPTWAATTAAELQQLLREHQRLAGSGVAEQFKLWQQDAARRDEWAGQLADVTNQIDSIPEAARIPTAEAERLQKEAVQAAKLADTAAGVARDELTALTRQAKDLAEVQAQIVAAEAEARVHGKLDDLLGKKKLQRELVRTAEAEIVRLANDTARNLSNGDLSIELQPTVKDEEALLLSVRRDGSPPIDVAYLSGSQKFRVAVAVALAIGRFAAGQARPLECVIIDEGFGSLDKDGLRATAEELNNLKRHLRRIILVSHQEDFTDAFPVRYVLRKGEAGTTAEKVRR